jgi:Domain of unknown function (DUF222)
MSQTPVPRDAGQDDDLPGTPAGPGDRPSLGSPDWQLVPCRPDWDEAYLAAMAHDEYPGDPDLYEDPDNAPPHGLDDEQLAALLAEAREITAAQAHAAEAAARLGHTAALAAVAAEVTGRRGPGMPGSAQGFPGEYPSPAAGFASGQPLDVAPGCATLGSFLEDAAGADDRYVGATDDELLGVICAWDRLEANASAGKHAAVAELIRRRPAPGAAIGGPVQLPEGWHEFTGRELGAVLGVSAGDAEAMLDLSWHLEVSLPGTRAVFRSGILSRDKAAIIANAVAVLDPAEARAAEAMVLGRAGSLTPGGLRAAIGRAVMEVAPDKARKRREHMAKRTRVERWAEDSGNAGLAGRELPPAEVLAADQRVTAWARQLRKAGLEGGMDQLTELAVCLEGIGWRWSRVAGHGHRRGGAAGSVAAGGVVAGFGRADGGSVSAVPVGGGGRGGGGGCGRVFP